MSRPIYSTYSRATKCSFCSIRNVILANKLAFAVYDKFPVSDGHVLLIPRRHVITFFETTSAKRRALDELLFKSKKLLDEEFAPDGYNVGINVGVYAGQTIHHAHVHLIPRYKGDLKDPRGGIRGVIPRKRLY